LHAAAGNPLPVGLIERQAAQRSNQMAGIGGIALAVLGTV